MTFKRNGTGLKLFTQLKKRQGFPAESDSELNETHGKEIFQAQCALNNAQSHCRNFACGPMGPDEVVGDLVNVESALQSCLALGAGHLA